MKASKLILLLPLFFLMACSAAYEQVKEMDIKNPKNFKEHLLYNYLKGVVEKYLGFLYPFLSLAHKQQSMP